MITYKGTFVMIAKFVFFFFEITTQFFRLLELTLPKKKEKKREMFNAMLVV